MSQQSHAERGITLPPRREPEDESLEERLTDNAYNNILPARYLLKDEDGEVVEEQEELFPRVAKNIAVAEAVHTDEDVIIQPKHIKPDHPRRDELIDEVFKDDTQETALNERNAKYVSYDTISGDLPEDTKEQVERQRRRFEDAMERLRFMPNSPTLMNAGNELQQLSACFVDSPGDDMEDIHDTAKEASLVFQSGGGMGYAFWDLRPYGDAVGSTGGIASGPITFMETYDQMCQTIAQGGTRRGAQMGVMKITHPDVIEFIHVKNKDVSLAKALMLNDPKDPTHSSFKEALEEARELITDDGKVPKHLRNACEAHLSNFNISVGVTDDFMEALENGEDFTFINPRTGEPHVATEETEELWTTFDLGEYVEAGEVLEVPAEKIWESIIQGAHENGEPGVIYLERVNEKHSFDVEKHPEHEILATNPCGEQPLEEYEACNLGHINLSTIAAEDTPDWRDWSVKHLPDFEDFSLESQVRAFLGEAIRWDEFNERIALGTRFLDNVVTMSDFPIDKIERKVRNMRKIGLGVMGLAQLYVQLGVEYGSETGNEIARQLMRHINYESKSVSHELANERGVFGEWDKSKYANPTEYKEWFERQTNHKAIVFDEGFEMRNHNTTTIAPTGTTSMVGNTSGGCEPIYNVARYKNVSQDVQGDEMLVEFDDYFLQVLEENDIDVEAAKKEAQDQMMDNEFEGVESLNTVPDEVGELFVVTSDLSAKEHAAVQCACQEGVDSAISKTVNAPNDASLEDTDEAFRFVYENGGKGVTYYRDGTRSKQVLTTRADNKADADEMTDEEKAQRIKELATEIDAEVTKKLNSEVDAELLEAGRETESDDGGCPECGGELHVSEGCEKCTECNFAKCEV